MNGVDAKGTSLVLRARLKTLLIEKGKFLKKDKAVDSDDDLSYPRVRAALGGSVKGRGRIKMVRQIKCSFLENSEQTINDGIILIVDLAKLITIGMLNSGSWNERKRYQLHHPTLPNSRILGDPQDCLDMLLFGLGDHILNAIAMHNPASDYNQNGFLPTVLRRKDGARKVLHSPSKVKKLNRRKRKQAKQKWKVSNTSADPGDASENISRSGRQRKRTRKYEP